MKIFSVGNSFSQNAHKFLNEIAVDAGCDLTLLNAYIGGCTLERHMHHADAYDKNPNDPDGSPYFISQSCGISLRQCLQLKKWDVVTIQQASSLSFVPESYHPHGDRLIALIRKHAPRAEIVVHQTWAYRDDHEFWERKDFSTNKMYRQLRATYADFCKKNAFRMIPSGDAFQKARRSKKWGKPIPADPQSSEPAIRSLHKEDKFHANDNGCYLIGCVWLEALFGKDARSLMFHPETIPESDAVLLREFAHQAVVATK